MAIANFINHTVLIEGRMNISERQKAKDAVGFSIYDCLQNQSANYYDSKSWQDNNGDNSILHFAIGYLVANKKEEESIDIESLTNLRTKLRQALKAKIWDIESKTDEIEAHVKTLARAVGQLQDYEDKFETEESSPNFGELISAERRVYAAKIKNAPDNFQTHVTSFYSGVSKHVDAIRKARIEMYQAGFMLITHVSKADKDSHLKNYLSEPSESMKPPMPNAERFLRWSAEIVDAAVTTFQTTQKSGLYAAGAAKAEL